MSTLERYQKLKAEKSGSIMGMISLLILELIMIPIYLHPEYFQDNQDYWVSLRMDGAIAIGLIIGLVSMFFPRKARKILQSIAILPIVAWFFFSGIPWAFHFLKTLL